MNGAFITATASYVPPTIVRNADLTQFPEGARQLIEEKTGVRERRHVTTECTSDVGAEAVTRLLAKAGIDAASVGALICATSSPDRLQPPTATRIQQLCGLTGACAFDVNAVCSGGVYALRLASALVRDGIGRVVVVAAEVYSKLVNPTDLSTFPYFGDGAGAVLVTDIGRYEICDVVLHSDGSGADIIQIPAGGTMLPVPRVSRPADLYFKMLGAKVFEFACHRGAETITQLAERYGVVPDRVVVHQANVNIINAIAEKTGIQRDRFFVNLDRYGNTAGASVLIALDESLRDHARDEHIFLAVFGGGLAWAGAYLRASNA